MKIIDFQGVAILMQNDVRRLFQHKYNIPLAALTVLLFCLYSFLSNGRPETPGAPFNHLLLKFHFFCFPMLLFIGGALFTDFVFAPLLDRNQGKVFLSTPASDLEKMAAKWILSGLLFPLAVLVLYQLFVLLSGLLIYQLLGIHLTGFSLIDPFAWSWIALYVGLQPMFLLGAISLGRFAALKTALIGVALLVVATIVLWAIFSLTTSDPPSLTQLLIAYISPVSDFQLQISSAHLFAYLKPLMLSIGAPLLLLTAWFKFKEKEVNL